MVECLQAPEGGLKDRVVKVQTTLVAGPGFEPAHRGIGRTPTGSIAHELVKHLLVSANGTKRGPFVVMFLDGALVGVLEKP